MEKNWQVIKYIDDGYKDMNMILKHIEFFPEMFEYVPDKWKNNYHFILQCIEKNPLIYKYLNDNLKNQEVIIQTVIEKSKGEVLEYFQEYLKNDEEIVKSCIQNKEPSNLKYASEKIRDNKKFIMELFRGIDFSIAYSYLSIHLQRDIDILTLLISNILDQRFFEALYQIPDDLLENKQFALLMVKIKPKILHFLPFRHQRDKDIVLKTVESDPFMIENIIKKFHNDRDIIETVVKKYGELMKIASKDLFQDKELVLIALENQGKDEIFLYSNWKYVDIKNYIPKRLLNDKDIIEKLNFKSERLETKRVLDLLKVPENFFEELQENPKIFTNVPEIFKDYFFIEQSIKTNSYIYNYLDEKYQKDMRIINFALKESDGVIYNDFSDELKEVEEVIFNFCKYAFDSDYDSIPEKKLDDRGFVLKIIKEIDKNIYQSISNRLKKDLTILSYIIEDETIFKYIPKELFKKCNDLIHLIQLNPKLMNELDIDLKNDFEIIFKVIQSNIQCFKNYKYQTKVIDNKEIMKYVISKHGELLKYASNKIIKNKEMVMIALENQGKPVCENSKFSQDILKTNIIHFLPEKFLSDREILLKSIKKGLTPLVLNYI